MSHYFGVLFSSNPCFYCLNDSTNEYEVEQIKYLGFLFLFASMTPLGALLGLKFTPEQFGLDLHIILAVVVGMFLHISTTIIFETSENHKFNLLKLTSIIFGCGLAMLLY